MKTASVQQLPEQWPQILRWVAAGEEVAVTSRKKTVAKIVPVPDAANGKHEGSVVKKRKAAGPHISNGSTPFTKESPRGANQPAR